MYSPTCCNVQELNTQFFYVRNVFWKVVYVVYLYTIFKHKNLPVKILGFEIFLNFGI